MPTNNSDVTYETLNRLATECYQNSFNHGFYDEYFDAMDELTEDESRKFVGTLFCLSRHALIMSESGEGVEAVRKPGLSSHVENMDAELEEVADIMIRCFDYAGFRGWDIGDAILRKMQYNASRPYKHGKLA